MSYDGQLIAGFVDAEIGEWVLKQRCSLLTDLLAWPSAH